ncbi:MAG TPA: DUF1553 domain-containing protein, partial [Pirellulaceae bacterium]|nr:DUF1553 domain-containing protein [Pirellulaceae bacterium]
PTSEAAARRAELLQQIAQREQTLPERFPAQSPLRWQMVDIDKLTAESKASFEKLTNGEYRVAGENPAQDSYTLEFTADLENITHLKLEALTDAALLSTGPGRTPHGNFVLTEIQVHVAPRAGDAATPVKIASASADFEQEKYPAADAIDGNPKSGWAIQGPGKWNTPRAATFAFEKPITIAGGTKWTITLQQHYGSQHTLGKFRLSMGQTINDPNQQLSGRERFNAEFAKWIDANAPPAVAWTPLTPASAISDSPTLTVLDDGSVLASGDQTKRDQYRLQYKFAKQTITAIRLDAIADDRLPQRGPGRIYYEGPAGDFFLSEVTAQAGEQPVAFAKAAQSSGTNAQMAIDGDPQSGWSINGGQGRDHSAIFVLNEPLRDVDSLQLQLLFERYYAAGLGRFRVSVTAAPNAAERVKLPVAVEQGLRTPNPNNAEVLIRYFASIAPELAAERAAIEKLRQQSPEIATTLAMVERSSEHPRKTLLRHRGEFLQPKEEVAANVLSVLNPLPAEQPRTRLAFAQWLVNGDSPLTGRVTVNRQWAAFFGRGLVKSTEDFGLQGDLPSHPELLDWLAIEFVERGWSMKDLHRLIVTSSTYRQASRITPALAERDPQNVLLARGARVRLEGELVRDNALRIAGLLSYKVGGRSVFPPQPASVTTEGAYGGLAWNVSPGEDRYRRGLYTFAKRTAPYAMLGTFDGPSGEACVARREVSNSPLQALVLLNDEVFLEVAQTLGREFAAWEGDDTTRLTTLFRRVLVRPPTTVELATLTDYLQAQRKRFESKELDAAAIAGPGGQANERALWTVVARALLNLDETITKD